MGRRASVARGQMSKNKTFPTLEEAINEESYNWVSENYPALAKALEEEVKAGGKPEDIRRFIVAQTQREALALRLEQAAKHLKKQ